MDTAGIPAAGIIPERSGTEGKSGSDTLTGPDYSLSSLWIFKWRAFCDQIRICAHFHPWNRSLSNLQVL